MNSIAISELTKTFYKITEVAAMFDLENSTLHHWEKEFDVLKPRKNSAGDRTYTKQDIEVVQRIFFLLKTKGYTTDGARKILLKGNTSVDNNIKVIEKLKSIRGFLSEIRDSL